jgi:hypothetical protein
MMFSVPIWAGLFGQELGRRDPTLMMWFSGIVGAPCALYAGLPFFRSAWRSLKARRANMDVPISIGVLLTLAISFSETILGGRDAYFDARVSLLFLLLIGRWLEHRLRARASSAAADLLALQSPTATILGDDDALIVRPLAECSRATALLLPPRRSRARGLPVLVGTSELDNSLLTGRRTPPPVDHRRRVPCRRPQHLRHAAPGGDGALGGLRRRGHRPAGRGRGAIEVALRPPRRQGRGGLRAGVHTVACSPSSAAGPGPGAARGADPRRGGADRDLPLRAWARRPGRADHRLGAAVPARRAGEIGRGAGAAGRGRPRSVRQDRRPDAGPSASCWTPCRAR